jgi:soluble lytic murein transglycosylase-like protein
MFARGRNGFTANGMPFRGLAVVALAVSVVATALAWRNPAVRTPPHHAVHTARIIRTIVPATAQTKPAPQKITLAAKEADFDKEQKMSPAALMNRWSPQIAQASKRFAVPQTWIRAVMKIESGGRTMLAENQPIVSSAGALGLMQIMPATYEDMRGQYGLGPDPQAPHDNIFAGAAYLHWLYGKYGYPAMFAAYNDGPGNLEARLIQGQLLPTETQNYVGNITLALGTGAAASHQTQVRFTRPNGVPVWIDTTQVVSVRAPFAGEYAPGVQSVIAFGRVRQGVCENVDLAKAAIRARGGRV